MLQLRAAAPGAARSFRTPSRPSARGQVDAAQSGPTIAAHSALRRTRIPPPRLLMIGAASFEHRDPGGAGIRAALALAAPAEVGLPANLALSARSAMRIIRSETKPRHHRGTPDPTALLAWYDRHRRDLPWRAPPGMRPDPYRVWLSEIMLQQTTVANCRPIFRPIRGALARYFGAGRSLARRRPAALAGARLLRPRPQPACLRPRRGRAAWRRISAKSRRVARAARYRRLHRGGDRRDRFRPARGRGRRQCRARHRSASTRCPNRSAAKPRLKALAAALVPERRAGDFAQALMDLGATICTPRRPRCVLCPWRPAAPPRRPGLPRPCRRKPRSQSGRRATASRSG